MSTYSPWPLEAPRTGEPATCTRQRCRKRRFVWEHCLFVCWGGGGGGGGGLEYYGSSAPMIPSFCNSGTRSLGRWWCGAVCSRSGGPGSKHPCDGRVPAKVSCNPLHLSSFYHYITKGPKVSKHRKSFVFS